MSTPDPRPAFNWGGSLARSMDAAAKNPTATAAHKVGVTCAGCEFQGKQRAHAEERLEQEKAKNAELLTENTSLRAQVNAMPPTDREFAALRTRLWALSLEESAQRHRADALEQQLRDAGIEALA